MFEIHDRHKWKKRFYSKPVFVALLILSFVTVRGAWSVYGKKVESEHNLAQVAVQVEAMRERERELDSEIAKLATDRGVEEEIRKKFSVVRDGEVMVVLVDGEEATTTEPAEERGFFGKLWDKLVVRFKGD